MGIIIKGKRGLVSGSLNWTLDDYLVSLFARQLSHENEEMKIARRVFSDKRVDDAFDLYCKLLENVTSEEFQEKTKFHSLIYSCHRCEDTRVYFNPEIGGMQVCNHR